MNATRLLGALRLAFRQLRRSPGFSAVVIGIIALGIGAMLGNHSAEEATDAQ